MKKLISMFLALILVIGLIPASVLGVSADDAYSGTCGDNAVWTFDANTGTLTISGTGPMSDFYSTNPQPWKSLRNQITVLVVEPDITGLSYGAFEGCRNLKMVSLPSGLSKINSFAFYGCKSLEELVLPDTVTVLEAYAFDACTALKRIALSNALQRIGNQAFAGCSSLETITLPKSLTDMDPVEVFSGCTSIRMFTVAEGNPAFSSDSFGILYNGNATRLLLCPNAVSGAVSVPSGVNEIGPSAFAGHSGMTKISLPDTVTVISRYAFASCSQLRAAALGSGVEQIGEVAFYNCTALEQINLPGSLKIIGAEAFSHCSALKQISLPLNLESIGNFAFCEAGLTGSLEIPASLECIGEYAFDQCPYLQRFDVAAGNKYYSSDASGILFDRNKTILIRCPQALSGNYTVPSSVITISSSAFDSCSSMTAVILPEGLEYIGNSAFRLCSSLTELAFPAFLSADSYYSYFGCSSLKRYVVDENNPNFSSDASGLLYNKTMTTLLRCPEHYNGACILPDEVTSCDSSAFHDCSHVTSLYLPASWSSDEYSWESIFFHLRSLQTISVAAENPCVTSQNGVLYSKDMKRLIGCPAGFVGVCEVASGTTVIQNNAFLYCGNLDSVQLPEGLQEIGEYAFYGCQSMMRIDIPESVVSIGDRALGYYDPTMYEELKGMSIERLRGFAIYGYRNTAAEVYADESNFDFYDLSVYEEGKTEFDDVAFDAWYARPVHWAVWRGIVTGTGEGTFSPKKACTRAEIVTMLWRAMGSPEPETVETPFEDVKLSSWYAKAVAWAVENGITSGTSASTFSPKQPCTRAQVVTFLWKALSPYMSSNVPELPFTDVKDDAWYAKAVSWAVQHGITSGTSATTFSPNQPCTRAQVVTFLWQTKESYYWGFG